MGWFDLFKRPRAASRPAANALPVMRTLPTSVEAAPAPPAAAAPPGPTELRRMLFDAVATGDEEKLARLCRDHHDFLLAYADAWSIVPDALSANPDAARWYGEGLHAIAHFCAERLGRPELQERLRADGGRVREARDARETTDVYAA